MKREVLRLSGCKQEFFISHNLEATSVADFVIDLNEIYLENKRKQALV